MEAQCQWHRCRPLIGHHDSRSVDIHGQSLAVMVTGGPRKGQRDAPAPLGLSGWLRGPRRRWLLTGEFTPVVYRLHTRLSPFNARKKCPVVANVAIARELAGRFFSLAVMPDRPTTIVQMNTR